MEKYYFLRPTDDLGKLIQAHALELYKRLSALKPETLQMPDHCLRYYRKSHGSRLFFSVQTSAVLLYRSIRRTGKAPGQIVLMDYGAGVGTLYLLAKMIGCRKVIYNDHLEDWKESALLIAEAIGVHVDHYLVGDTASCLHALNRLDLQCGIITSRNVIEHIYDLGEFYQALARHQPQALVYSSTTANPYNPATVLKHRLWHRKWEKVYLGKRKMLIGRKAPGLTARKTHRLAVRTRGLAGADLDAAIESYRRTGALPDPRPFGTNTCDPETGVWAERLVSGETYRKWITAAGYHALIGPGFWDTHYSSGARNRLSRTLNRIIARGGRTALRAAPFIYVVAEPCPTPGT